MGLWACYAFCLRPHQTAAAARLALEAVSTLCYWLELARRLICLRQISVIVCLEKLGTEMTFCIACRVGCTLNCSLAYSLTSYILLTSNRMCIRREFETFSSSFAVICATAFRCNCYWITRYAVRIKICLAFLPRCMECRRGLAMRILSVRLSVCQTRALWFSLVFWEEEFLVRAILSTWNFGSADPRLSKIADFEPAFARSASAVTPSEKSSINTIIGSPQRAFQWA